MPNMWQKNVSRLNVMSLAKKGNGVVPLANQGQRYTWRAFHLFKAVWIAQSDLEGRYMFDAARINGRWRAAHDITLAQKLSMSMSSPLSISLPSSPFILPTVHAYMPPFLSHHHHRLLLAFHSIPLRPASSDRPIDYRTDLFCTACWTPRPPTSNQPFLWLALPHLVSLEGLPTLHNTPEHN